MKPKYVTTIIKHIVIWTAAFFLWTLLRNYGQEVISDYNDISQFNQIATILVLGVIAGILFGVFEIVFERYVNRNMALGKLVLISSISYLTIIFTLIFCGGYLFHEISGETFYWQNYKEIMFSKQVILLLVYFFIIITLTSLFNEIDKRLGQGNLWKLLKGEFYTPKEDHRIFLFIDLKSSTTIAENIGHLQYSKLLQDCFYDLNVVEKSKAELYQHVGDEAVLTWPTAMGIAQGNCLQAFYDFKAILLEKAEYYQQTYGVVPEFKAGMHFGNIVVAEVGNLKREIAYHGDTINIAARLQEKCNELGKEMLISAKMKEELKPVSGYSFEFQG